MLDANQIVAFIPAAGLGTRLKPLTNDKPKALVEFLGKPMLLNTIENLAEVGIKKFIVNTHHFSQYMYEYIHSLLPKYDVRISDESDNLLDTGGGICKAAQLLKTEENVLLVHNVDVYTQLNLNQMWQFHIQKKADLTLAISDRESSRKLIFANNILCGWKNTKTGEIILTPGKKPQKTRSFSGIHLINKTVINYKPKKEAFPVIPWYIQLASILKIVGWEHTPDKWNDLGTKERIELAAQQVSKKKNNDTKI